MQNICVRDVAKRINESSATLHARPKNGYVYAMSDGILTKVGFSECVLGRLENVNRERTTIYGMMGMDIPDCPMKIEAQARVCYPRAVEAEIHKALAHKRADGEWYLLDADEMASLRSFFVECVQ